MVELVVLKGWKKKRETVTSGWDQTHALNNRITFQIPLKNIFTDFAATAIFVC